MHLGLHLHCICMFWMRVCSRMLADLYVFVFVYRDVGGVCLFVYGRVRACVSACISLGQSACPGAGVASGCASGRLSDCETSP